MIEHRNFVKKLVFPLETLPVNLVLAGAVTQVFALAIFVSRTAGRAGSVPSSVFWLPVLIVPQLLLAAGLCWFLSALGVFVRDLGQIIGFLLTLWFFLTPICYAESADIPASSRGSYWRAIRSWCWCAATARFSWRVTRRGSARWRRCGSAQSSWRCWATRGFTGCGEVSRM